MKLIRAWFKKKALPTQKITRLGSLESKQTGSCGGMSTTELSIRIELILSGIKIKASIMESVAKLAKLSHLLQSQFLIQLEEVSEISMSHAYSMMLVYGSALSVMNTEEHGQWVDKIIQAVKAHQLIEANNLIDNYSDFSSQIDTSAVLFSHVVDILEKLIFSITQQEFTLIRLDVSIESLPYIKDKSIFLPESISVFDNYQDNYLLYKVVVFHLLGQIECQTYLAFTELKEEVAQYGDNFLILFSTLETLRINQYLKKRFPGIWNNILNIHSKLNLEHYPQHLFSDDIETTVFDSLAWARNLRLEHTIFDPLPYQSDFSPEKLSYGLADTKTNSPPILMNIYTEEDGPSLDESDNQTSKRVYFKHNANADAPSSPDHSQSDTLQNLAEIMAQHNEKQDKLKNEQNQHVYLYPEWDISLKQYQTDWCRVVEIPIEQHMNALQTVHDPQLKFFEYRIKKSLDLLINDQKFIRYQSDGDEIDIDAWVSAKANKAKHADDFQNLYIRNNKNSRNVAILFAVDISGSTAGWKNETIKQSTWLLSRTLAKLNDQYAIYAFSGSGRENCHIYPIKKFNEKYNDHIKQRIFSLEAQQYTRMGAAIRHLTKTLKQTEAKTKVLFVLTDGKPDDIDSYRGHYGIEDTRRAFNEAKAQQINPFVLTFDQEAMDYLPYMLGKKHFRLISNIAMLPLQISTIYKQLTT